MRLRASSGSTPQGYGGRSLSGGFVAAAAMRHNRGMTIAEPPASTGPSVSERDAGSLRRYLLSFRWPFRNEEVHQRLVDGGLPLWRRVLALTPNPKERGQALELGSPPFHITLLL